ncbi:MAG: CopD family protein [Gammaproteobacteria bacterium]|nr:CopD family protein [Gammaproteobacteria bacterium]
MAEYGWELATVLSKFVIYLGMSAAVGGIFIMLMTVEHRTLVLNIKKYCLCLISGAIVAAGVNFFIQVGSFAEAGLAGMFDEVFIELLWQSPIGDALILILLALVVMLVSCLLAGASAIWLRYLSIVLTVVGLVVLSKAFTLVGHTSQLSLATQVILAIHLSIAAWWLGALWPLWRACFDVPNQALHGLMKKFGNYAVINVLVLIICGTVLGVELVGSFEALFLTIYGLGIAIKLLTVNFILLLGAHHKWTLVPALLKQQSSKVLASSLKVEIYLGLTILVITTVVSTLIGPFH